MLHRDHAIPLVILPWIFELHKRKGWGPRRVLQIYMPNPSVLRRQGRVPVRDTKQDNDGLLFEAIACQVGLV